MIKKHVARMGNPLYGVSIENKKKLHGIVCICMGVLNLKWRGCGVDMLSGLAVCGGVRSPYMQTVTT